MSRGALAVAAGIDPKTIYNLEEQGKWPIARVRASIEQALGWQVGEMKRISDEPQQARIPAGLLREIMNAEGLTPEERQAVIAAVEETLSTERRSGEEEPSGPAS